MVKTENKFSFIICDDDSDDQLQISEAIKTIDVAIQYTSVYHGNQLLDLLLKRGVYKGNNQAQACAVILDICMPVMDGLAALREIKQNPLLKQIPVFILYTLRKEDHTTICRDLGVSGIYAKPSTSEGFKSIISEIYTICGGVPVLSNSVNAY